jgi:ASC-1-like (ASCH) protein
MPGSQPRREINIRQEYLKLIIDDVKTVEVRVRYPRMRPIQPGQELTFVSGDQRVPTSARRVTEYWSFE